MEIQYRLAKMEDLDDICRLVGNAIECMEAHQIDQWDEYYPAREDFAGDIRKKELYVGMAGDEAAVIYTLNRECDDEYGNGHWKFEDCEYRVIHRLCVNPKHQNRGVAKRTLAHVERELGQNDVGAVRLDVFSGNPFARRLYTDAGYETVGFADWRKGRFLLMEKGLGK